MSNLSIAIRNLSPLAYYQCTPDDAAFNCLLDYSGNGYNLTRSPTRSAYSTHEFSGGYLGHRVLSVQTGNELTETAFSFCRLIPDTVGSDPLQIDGSFTVFGIIKLDAGASLTEHLRLLSVDAKGESLTSNILIGVWLQSSTNSLYAFHEYDSGSNLSSVFSSLIVTPGQEHVIAIRRDAATKVYSAYLDGTKIDLAFTNNAEKYNGGGNNQYLKIGGSSSETTIPEQFDFSNFALWDSALSDSQIDAIFAAYDNDVAGESSVSASVEIAGVVTLDGSPAQADLYLVDLAQLTPVQSSATDGSYQFLDSGDNSVIPNSDQIYMLCDYGAGVRPLAHGPITPMVYEDNSGGGLWTPAEITTTLWLDAADVDTITESSGAVSEWADKSGNAIHAISVATAHALIANFSNSLPAVYFNNSRYTLLPGIDLRNKGIYVVVRCDVVGAAQILSHTSLNTQVRFNGTSIEIIGNPEIFGNTVSSCYTTGAIGLIALDALASDGALYFNGSFESTLGDQGSSVYFNQLGARASGHEYLEGAIAEVIVVNDTTNREKCEGYLAHKWGLEASLPADHPYKSAAPTSGA